MAAVPLERLDLQCASVAEHLGFVALADVATAIANTDLGEKDSRVIGGHMVALHVLRWDLNLSRATQDVDLGVKPLVVQDTELTDQLEALGYSQFMGNRFRKQVDNLPNSNGESYAVVDVLVPTYTSRARHNRKFGDHLVTTEVPGLAAALKNPAVDIQLTVRLLDGSTLEYPVRLPNELSALTLKVMARTVRSEDRDAVDVWRSLEICEAAGIRDIDFGSDAGEVKRILEEEFGRGGRAIQEIGQAQSLSTDALTTLETRIQALIARCCSS